MRSASGLITLSKWQHKPTFANVSQSATNNLAIPLRDWNVSEATPERLCLTYMIDIGHRIAKQIYAINTHPRGLI